MGHPSGFGWLERIQRRCTRMKDNRRSFDSATRKTRVAPLRMTLYFLVYQSWNRSRKGKGNSKAKATAKATATAKAKATATAKATAIATAKQPPSQVEAEQEAGLEWL